MGLKIALVGATGAVGAVFLQILPKSKLKVDELRLYASKRSTGTRLAYDGKSLVVQEATPDVFRGVDFAFISATTEVSRTLCPAAAKAGAIAIDDSSAFRLEDNVPLVVPEVNAEDLAKHQRIVATPNCTTVPLVMALHALRRAAPVTRVTVATSQAVSGAGAAAVRELTDQTKTVLGGGKAQPSVFPHQIAFNALPQVDAFMEDGYTKEEWKMQQETRKILHMSALPFSATCVRVPVYQAHSMSVQIEFAKPVSPSEARALLSEMPGVRVVDDMANKRYPLATEATNADDVLVGRIRKDSSLANGLALWLSADNLRKGAALNMIQIAEAMVAQGLVRGE
ncbi:MAG: aspartate-semialdehyde dehydrogenase [Chloroflexi bacterium]|nr:aspartate-semialdehyde dehydrogenase [Chloroflexota bacterium]